jgi:predicted tellurium resistance membrane protein TerC
MEWLTDPEAWIALLTLTALEIVLGIDNIVFISILVGRLPEKQRQRGRVLGLGFAMITRIGLLFSIAWLMTLEEPLFTFVGREISGRDLILIAGGLFLLWKSVHEIHGSLEGEEDEHVPALAASSFAAIIAQIAIIDIVFSLDSVITAVGMVRELWVMVAAVVLAMIAMVVAATPLANFVNAHPTVKMLALSFLLLVGVALVADGLHFHIPRGYLYFAIAFSALVEAFNLIAARRRQRFRLKASGEIVDEMPMKS